MIWIAASLRVPLTFSFFICRQTHARTPVSISASHTCMHMLSKMELPAIKVNSEMYDFKLRYFLATEEWQQRGWVHPAGGVLSCQIAWVTLLPLCGTKGKAEPWQGCLAPSTSHNASCSSQPTAGAGVERSLRVGHVRHTHESVPVRRIHRRGKITSHKRGKVSKWEEDMKV